MGGEFACELILSINERVPESFVVRRGYVLYNILGKATQRTKGRSQEKRMRRFEIRNKGKFKLMCILWFCSLVFFGMIQSNIGVATMAMCVCSLLTCWQTDLDGDRLTKAVFISAGINIFLACIAAYIPYLLMGDILSFISGILEISIILGVIVGLPFLIINIIRKKNGIGWNETFTQEKDYTEDEREKKIKQSYRIARRASVMSYLADIMIIQLLVSLAFMIILPLTMDLSVEMFKCPEKSETWLPEGIFITLAMVFLALMVITTFWYVFAYKRLEIRCLHLGGELEGAVEFNDDMMRANFNNSLGKMVNVPIVTTGGIFSIGRGLVENYLISHGKPQTKKINFTILNIILSIAQIGILVGELIYFFS